MGVITHSTKRFLLVLVAFLGARQAFSSTHAWFSLLALLLMALSLFPQMHAQAQTPPSFGTKTVADQTFGLPGTNCSGTYSATVSLTLPEATGGTITYALSGQPASLTFTASSRRLSGTLAANLKQASAVSHPLTYTATSGGGSDSLTFKVAIVDERPALEALYASTDGTNWKTSTNWAADIPDATCLEDLHGVTLDNRGRVTRLRLLNNQMSGSIPTALGSLTGLTTLLLYSNQLSGSIPTALGNLTSLTELWLYDNQLSGSIPTALGNLTNLTILYLDNNQLSGSIPTELGSLTSLQELRLFNNQMSGSIPTELGDLTSLTELYLQNNQLSGSIPTALGNLTSLTGLYLYDNELSGPIPDLSSLTSLTKLWLFNNNLSGSIPSELGSLTNLTDLQLYNNNLSGSIPTELGSLTGLTILYLYDNELSGSIPTELGSLTSLTSLRLYNNQLSGSIPSELDNLTGLTNLQLHNNNLSGEIPDLNNLNLSHLYLHNNRLTGPVPEFTRATGHFRLSLYGNPGLYGYPAVLNNRSLLRLLAPGDGSAVCLPSTKGGADCVIPTKVDNLGVQASGQQLVFSWVPNPANPAPSGYNAEHFPSPSGPWTSASVTGTTATTPDAILSFLVCAGTTDPCPSPRLYYIPGFSPLFTLSVNATPACETLVTDLSMELEPLIRLRLDPPGSMLEVEYAGINDSNQLLLVPGSDSDYWSNAGRLSGNGRLSVYVNSVVEHYRENYPGFAGFKFRLKNRHVVTAQCLWTFDPGNTGGTPTNPPTGTPPPNTGGPPPNTGETDPGGGGDGGGGPALSGDASLSALEISGISPDFDTDTYTYTVSAYDRASVTVTPTANHDGAEITVTVNGETVEKEGTSYPVTLDEDGETIIKIVVTAEDRTVKTYTLTVMSCPGEERKILEMFYDSTQGDMWEESSGWNIEDDLGNWHGVKTQDGRVAVLSLPDNNLSGDIPSALLCFEELSGLSELALWDNDGLSGEIPDEFTLAVERAVLRDVAVALSLNAEWFESYGDPYNFEDWHEGVTTDDDGRVVELDLTGEGIEGEIPESVFELKRLRTIETGCGVTLGAPAPGRVSVTMAEGCSDASLGNIEISPGELAFSPMDLFYETAVGYGPESITVTPETNHPLASVTINGEDAVSGESVEITLNEDLPTVVSIEVTARDGTTTRTYEITVTRCGADDRWALVRFYEASGGEDWNDNENWNSEEPLGQWFGVRTDEDGSVISLRLTDNGLSGETPRELLCLSELKELALWDNDGLSGEIPEELTLAVERAALRDVAVALSLNAEWFDTYEDPYGFGDWHEGVTTDDEGRVTELDFTGEDITGEIPDSVFELQRLRVIETGCEVTLEATAPGRVSVTMAEGCEEIPEETPTSGGGGCALGSGSGDSPVFALFLMTLLVFAALGRKRARG